MRIFPASFQVSMLKAAIFALIAGAGITASAQVERIPFRGDGPGGDSIGDARFIRSGALLMASFDANHDFIVSDEEIEAGAASTFLHADADNNGYVSPLEQRAWAARVTSETDVLGNSSFFISAIPGQVGEKEFIAGIKIFSERFRDQDGQIHFSSFTFEPKGRDGKEKDKDVARLRRPNVSAPRNSDGRGSR